MYSQDINEGYIKRDPWVKSLKKAFAPDEVAELVKKRLEKSNITGPFVKQNEIASDIVNSFIESDEDYKKKIVPAIGLLLYNLLYGKTEESHEVLRGVFSIIANSKLTDCALLLRKWLVEKKDAIHCDDIKWKTTYREGMIAYAYVQTKEEAIEHWWYNVWSKGTMFWWSPAFLGMRIQNPALAGRELKTLVRRNYEKGAYLIAAMYSDERTRPQFLSAVGVGLKDNDGWAGLAINQLLEKLDSEDKKNELMVGLKKVVYLA